MRKNNFDPILDTLGPLPIAQSGLFNCALTLKAEPSQKYCKRLDKEAVPKVKLHREIQDLKRTLEKKEAQIKALKVKVAESNQVRSGNIQCCCDELRTIHRDKEEKLTKLSEFWRSKTNELISQH